jgi:glycosyltransferase involved in cell wall biosynthesis
MCGENTQTHVAQAPYLVFNPNTLLSIFGLLRGGDTTRPTPAADWRDAIVELVIPARNEQENIVPCLASVLRQTLRPRRIVLVDDGSSDQTAVRARAFCAFHDVELVVVQHVNPRGKTPAIKQQTRALDGDVLFVLDADTILESPDYIERTVHDLYQAVGIASACGMVLPLREADRCAVDRSFEVAAFLKAFPAYESAAAAERLGRLATRTTILYREVLYLFLQRLVYRGQMKLFGTLCNPVGCAVAYRRTYLEALFDHVEPLLGDNLTNSEDVFIGFAMLEQGYRNIQVADVRARTVEPPVHRLPKQLYLWSSAFLQSAFYFDALMRSPFKAAKRWWHRRRGSGGSPGGLGAATGRTGSVTYAGMRGVLSPPHAFLSIATDTGQAVPGAWERPAMAGVTIPTRPARERRQVQEPFRQPFGREHTRTSGRPIGWTLLFSAIEKVGFPTVLLVMTLLGSWEALLITAVAETFLTVVPLVVVMKDQRLEYLLKGVAVTPIRYALLAWDFVTLVRFVSDVWLTRNRRWRK